MARHVRASTIADIVQPERDGYWEDAQCELRAKNEKRRQEREARLWPRLLSRSFGPITFEELMAKIEKSVAFWSEYDAATV